MAVKGVAAPRGLAGGTDVETRRIADVYVLVRAFADTTANDREVFLAVASGSMRVDERRPAWLQITVTHYPAFKPFDCHRGVSFS